MEGNNEERIKTLNKRRKEISDKIAKHNDPFFTYGWWRQIEEIDREIYELKTND